MRQAYGLDQVGVRAQGEGDALGNLRHFEGVGETGAEKVSLVDPKHLGFPLQPDGRIDAAFPCRLRIEVLKAFESYKVIYNPRVTTLGHKGKEVLRRLFAVLDQGRESLGLFPEDHGEAYEQALLDGDETARKRVICDFLAGMTDSYALRFYSRLFLPGEGSFYEML